MEAVLKFLRKVGILDPILPKIQTRPEAGDSWVSRQFPRSGNFWPEEKDPVVLTCLKILVKTRTDWFVTEGDARLPCFELGPEWYVLETDDCLDFSDLTFYKHDTELFTVHHHYDDSQGKWVWRSRHILRPVFEAELRELIIDACSSALYERRPTS